MILFFYLQGRESKHLQIKSYLKHTPASTATTRWQVISRHEFAEQILLTECLGRDSYRRPKSEIEREKVKLPTEESLAEEQAVLDAIKESCREKTIVQSLQKYRH